MAGSIRFFLHGIPWLNDFFSSHLCRGLATVRENLMGPPKPSSRDVYTSTRPVPNGRGYMELSGWLIKWTSSSSKDNCHKCLFETLCLLKQLVQTNMLNKRKSTHIKKKHLLWSSVSLRHRTHRFFFWILIWLLCSKSSMVCHIFRGKKKTPTCHQSLSHQSRVRFNSPLSPCLFKVISQQCFLSRFDSD